MPRRSKTLLDRAERANQSALPIVVFLSGDPEPHRLLGRSLGVREAMIGGEIFSALDGESERQFYRRLAAALGLHVKLIGEPLGRLRLGEPTAEGIVRLRQAAHRTPAQAPDVR
jgi:hypothetical protein